LTAEFAVFAPVDRPLVGDPVPSSYGDRYSMVELEWIARCGEPATEHTPSVWMDEETPMLLVLGSVVSAGWPASVPSTDRCPPRCPSTTD